MVKGIYFHLGLLLAHLLHGRGTGARLTAALTQPSFPTPLLGTTQGFGRAPKAGLSPAGSQHSWTHPTFSEFRIKLHHLSHHRCCSLHRLIFFPSLPTLPQFGHLHPMPVSSFPQSTLPDFFADWRTLCFTDSHAPSHSGASDSSHGNTLLYLLPADLYISNACKLSPAANRPSLLILTSEGAWLYFSISSPSTFSFRAPLSPKWRRSLFKPTCYQ